MKIKSISDEQAVPFRLHYQKEPANGFYETLKQRVDEYFSRNHISKLATSEWYFKISMFIMLSLIMYFLILFGHFSKSVMLMLAYLLGVFIMFSGINIVHDAIHDSISKNKRVNGFFRFYMNLIGGNGYIWQYTHLYGHHTFPNVPNVDLDLVQSPLVRVLPDAPHKKIHRYQHIYMIPLYFMYTMFWITVRDFKHFGAKKIGNKIIRHPGSAYINLYVSKILYFFYMLILPWMLLPVSFMGVFAGFVVLQAGMGTVVIFVLLSNHVQEENPFPEPDDTGLMKSSWAVHQVNTTCDYLTDNRVLTYLFGGMNHHLAHHLFPDINHVHLKPITKLLKETAEEFHLNYKRKKWDIITSHFKLLKTRSVPE